MSRDISKALAEICETFLDPVCVSSIYVATHPFWSRKSRKVLWESPVYTLYSHAN